MAGQRATERDFLRENKKNLSYWESNGRVAAAAQAQAAPRWRPVVLHYPEKLRPHGETARHRRRAAAAAHESQQLRSGLAQPYGFTKDDHELRKVCGCDCARKLQQQLRQKREAGGWDNKRQPVQKKDMQEQRPAHSKALSKNQMQDNAVQAAPQYDSAAGGDGEDVGAAPLSARSTASVMTLKSVASMQSQDSGKSQATIKSQDSIKSRASVRSHASNRSHASIKSQASNRSEQQQRPSKRHASAQVQTEGDDFMLLSAQERTEALDNAHVKYNSLVGEYNRLPVSAATLRVRNRKVAIERELDELAYTINMYDQPSTYVRRY